MTGVTESLEPNPLSLALKACRRHFWGAALFSGLVNILYLVPSIFMLQVYDRVVPTRGGATLLILSLILTVSLIVFAVLDAVRMRLLLRASVRLERLAAPGILHRILGTTSASPAERSAAMKDFDTLRGTLTGPAIIAIFDAPWAPIYIIICFLLHPWIGVLALLASILLTSVAVWSDVATRKGVREAGILTSLSYRSQEYSVLASEVARALGMRGAMVARHLGERASLVQRQGEVAAISGTFLAVTKFLRLLFQSLALALGAWLAINQSISAGSIFAASLIIGRALQPVEQILGALRNVLAARNAYRGLDKFCQLPDASAPRTSLPAPLGRIEVNGVTVRAPGSDRVLLSDMSFTVEAGQIVALIGPSGSGKSTLLRVLAGALDPDEGEVRIDGARLDDWNRDELGEHIGYMPQTPTLFPASVYANISRFAGSSKQRPADLDQQVVAAAQAAGAHELILHFSQGYETRLHIREGGGLSAGQRQVVALARALFGAPRLLLLDEPNAHLDMQGEARLLKTLDEMRDAKTTVVVSTHRTGLLQAADKILLLRDGHIQLYEDRDTALRPEAAPVGRRVGNEPNGRGGDAHNGGGATGGNPGGNPGGNQNSDEPREAQL